MTSTTLGPPRSAAAGWYVAIPFPPPSFTIRPCVTPIPCSNPKTDRAAVLPKARTSGERTTRNCSLNHGRQAVSSSRVGVRFAGGTTHYDVGHPKHSARGRSPDLFENQLEQQPTTSPDEGFATLILVTTGRLADHHQGRSERSGTDDHPLARLGERATSTGWELGQVTTHLSQREYEAHEPRYRKVSPCEIVPFAIGPFVTKYLLVALSTQEDHLVARLHVVIAAVDHQHVHGDDPRERVPLAVNENFGTRVEEPSRDSRRR